MEGTERVSDKRIILTKNSTDAECLESLHLFPWVLLKSPS